MLIDYRNIKYWIWYIHKWYYTYIYWKVHLFFYVVYLFMSWVWTFTHFLLSGMKGLTLSQTWVTSSLCWTASEAKYWKYKYVRQSSLEALLLILKFISFLINWLIFILQLILQFFYPKCHVGTLAVKERRGLSSWRESKKLEERRKRTIIFLSYDMSTLSTVSVAR